MTITSSTGIVRGPNGRMLISLVAPSYNGVYVVSCTVGESIDFQCRYRYARQDFAATDLPTGLSINALTGVISGVVSAAAGSYASTVICTNVRGTVSQLIQWVVGTEVAQVPIILGPSALSGVGGQTFSGQIVGNYLTTEYATVTYAKVSGAPWVSVNSSTGALTSTETDGVWPVAGVSTSVVVKATNVNGDSSNFTISLSASAQTQAPIITSAAYSSATVGVPWSFQVTALYCDPVRRPATDSFSVDGAFPGSLVMDAETGIMTMASPPTATTYTFDVYAANPVDFAVQSFTLTVASNVVAPVLTNPDGSASPLTLTVAEDVAFTYPITATGNVTSYLATNLPAGVTLSGNILSGTIATPGTYTPTVTAHNSSMSDTETLTITVSNTVTLPVFTNSAIGTGIVGQAFSQQFTCDNGPILEWSGGDEITAEIGLSFNTSTGVLSGTPTDVAVAYVSIGARNEDGWNYQNYAYTITAATPWNYKTAAQAVITAPMALTGSYVSQPTQDTNPATTGRAVFTFAVPTTANYYLSCTVDVGNSGGSNSFFVEFDGTPTASNVWHIPIASGQQVRRVTWGTNIEPVGTENPKVWNLASGTRTLNVYGREANAKLYDITVVAEVAPSNVMAGNLNGQAGVPFSCQMTADGYPTSWSSSGLPAWASLNATSGLISGVPTAAGTPSFTVTATNGTGSSSPLTVNLTIAAGAVPTVTNAGSYTATEDYAYTASVPFLTLTATNSPTSFAIASGSLPTGMTLDTLTGKITGTATTAGVSTFTVTATNASGTSSASGAYTVTVITVTGRTFYVDYGAASDVAYGAQSGQSKSTPWKRAPGMQGFTGAYNHQAGDRIIFKGGVTWPRTCFGWNITSGGSGTNNRDYYGVDATWYTGASWARPIFDFESNVVSTYTPGVKVDRVNYVHIDNIEFTNFYSYGRTYYGGPDNLMFFYATTACRVTNCLFHNWTVRSEADGGLDDMVCVLFAGGANNDVDDCTFDGTSAIMSGRGAGEAVKNGQNHRRNTVMNVSNGFNVSGSGETAYNDIGPVLQSFTNDGTRHENGYQTLNPGTYYFHHNKVHDVYSGEVLYVGDAGTITSYIYDNLFYGVLTKMPLELYTSVAPAVGTCHFYNNTMRTDTVAIRNSAGGSGPPVTLFYRNNHLIGSQSNHLQNNNTVGDPAAIGAGGAQSNNIHETTAAAAANGAVIGTLYKPTAGPVINAGTDLSAYFTTDFLDVARPQGAAWDIGAYEQ